MLRISKQLYSVGYKALRPSIAENMSGVKSAVVKQPRGLSQLQLDGSDRSAPSAFGRHSAEMNIKQNLETIGNPIFQRTTTLAQGYTTGAGFLVPIFLLPLIHIGFMHAGPTTMTVCKFMLFAPVIFTVLKHLPLPTEVIE